jgi:hypothetical protein
MDAQAIALIITAIGGSAAVTAIVNGIAKLASGATQRERVRNTNIITQRAKAIEERIAAEQKRDDIEAELEIETRKRREAEEHVAVLQRQLILLGVEPLRRPEKKEKTDG